MLFQKMKCRAFGAPENLCDIFDAPNEGFVIASLIGDLIRHEQPQVQLARGVKKPEASAKCAQALGPSRTVQAFGARGTSRPLIEASE